MGTTTQNSLIEEWIIEHARTLWLVGATYKRASKLAMKDLGFSIHPKRISRLRVAVEMRIEYPYDEWHGRCRCSGFKWNTFLTCRQWGHMKAWIIKNKQAIATIADVDVLARLARLNRITGVSPTTMRVALYDTRMITGYDPNLTTEADVVASDRGSRGPSTPEIATAGVQESKDSALCKV